MSDEENQERVGVKTEEGVSRRVWSDPVRLEGIPRIEQQCNPGALVESSIRAEGGVESQRTAWRRVCKVRKWRQGVRASVLGGAEPGTGYPVYWGPAGS